MNMNMTEPYVADGLTLQEIRQDIAECQRMLKALRRGERTLKRRMASPTDYDSEEGRSRYYDMISRAKAHFPTRREARMMASRMFPQ